MGQAASDSLIYWTRACGGYLRLGDVAACACPQLWRKQRTGSGPTSLTGRLSLQWMRSEGTPPNTGPVYAPCGKLGKKRKFDIKPCLWPPRHHNTMT